MDRTSQQWGEKLAWSTAETVQVYLPEILEDMANLEKQLADTQEILDFYKAEYKLYNLD